MVVIHASVLVTLVTYIVFMHGNNWAVSPALPILLYLSLVLLLLFLYLTSCTDPGILPRKPIALREPLNNASLIKPGKTPPSQLRECDTCHIFRP